MQSLFITGTDTSVGKTVITALLALRLQSRGVDVGVMKPFATGCAWEGGQLINEDARWLKEITGVDDGLHLINPIRFEEPLAPLVAMRRSLSPDVLASRDYIQECLQAYHELQQRHDCVLVEGVGGLLVPLQQIERNQATAERGNIQTCVDLANALSLPVVVVARRTLGTINHTTLTCRVPLQAPAHFASLIFCDAEPIASEDVAAESSPAVIEEMTGLTSWGEVPQLAGLSRPLLSEAAEKYLNWPE